MNRIILTIILSGSLIIFVGLLFYFIPITIFPCTLTAIGNATTYSVCSLGYNYGKPEYVVAELTPIGQILQFLVTGAVPIAIAVLIVFVGGSTEPPRSGRRPRSSELRKNV